MSKNSLVLISYNFNNSPVEFRDKITLVDQSILQFINKSRENTGFIQEMAVLSTCNRTEFYFLTNEESSLFPWLAEQYKILRNIDLNHPDAPEPTVKIDFAAVTHLSEVSGGIKSQMLGENQILTQVKSAYNILLSEKHKNTIMNRLFREAIRAGKSVRANTALCKGSVSVSLAAVELARKIYSNFTDRNIVLIGAGETSELVAIHFQEMGAKNFTIINRGQERRDKFAEKFNAEAFALDSIEQKIKEADIIVTATNSPDYLITLDMCAKAMQTRSGRNLLIVDISSPRNVDPRIEKLSHVFLYNIDTIKFVIEGNLEKRRLELPVAKKIVEEIVEEYWSWFQTLEVVPTISKLHTYFNSVRNQEVVKYINKTDEKEYARLNELSTSLVRKLLHYPINELRLKNANGSHDMNKINALWELFHLSDLDENNE